MTQTSIVLREASNDDIEYLWTALAIAAHEENAEIARQLPVVALHLADWRRDCDFGCIAFGRDGVFYGAAWARQFTPDENPTFFHDAGTPEVTIGVVPHAQGRGVGKALLQRLIAMARARGKNLCLNVREDNPAVHLYRSLGFKVVENSVVKNRAGGQSFGMLYLLDD